MAARDGSASVNAVIVHALRVRPPCMGSLSRARAVHMQILVRVSRR